MESAKRDITDIVSIVTGCPSQECNFTLDYRVEAWLTGSYVYESSHLDIVRALWAAHNGADIDRMIGTKVGLGVLVSQALVDRFVSCYGAEAIEQMYVEYNVNLFGNHCSCSAACPPSNIFLGAPCYQKMMLSIVLLNRNLLPELTREICKLMPL